MSIEFSNTRVELNLFYKNYKTIPKMHIHIQNVYAVLSKLTDKWNLIHDSFVCSTVRAFYDLVV